MKKLIFILSLIIIGGFTTKSSAMILTNQNNLVLHGFQTSGFYNTVWIEGGITNCQGAGMNQCINAMDLNWAPSTTTYTKTCGVDMYNYVVNQIYYSNVSTGTHDQTYVNTDTQETVSLRVTWSTADDGTISASLYTIS